MRHKDELPERERLLVEAAQAGTITAQREALRGLLERFPDYWPGAWDYANLLVHWAPYLGSSYDEARTALENVVTLNPRFASAWQHLFWLAASQRDSGRAGVALDSMARLVDPGDMHWAFDLTYFRALNDAVHTGGVVSAEHERQMIQMVRTLAARVPQASWALTGSFTEFGFPAFQIRLNRRVLQSGPARQHAADLHLGTAMAWAARGAWDSAAVDLDEAVRLTTDLRDLLRAYGLSVMGVFLGGWNTDRAVARGAAATRVFALGPSDDRAELAWLDGLLCYARSDRAGLVRARARLQRSRSSETLLLDRSLRGFERMLQGDRAGAARTLERLEFDAGEQGAVGRYGAAHPYLSALDRLEASRWLLAVGDTMAAARLLTWYEATIPGDAYRADLPNRVAEPFALLERARIEVAQGRGDAAAFHYRLLAAVYDLPSSSQGSAMVAEALGALRRLPQARR
jgi:hypothetical protein